MDVVCDSRGRMAFPGHPGYLFGSSLTLDRGVANIPKWTEFPAKMAWDWASKCPARLFGIRLPKIRIPVFSNQCRS